MFKKVMPWLLCTTLLLLPLSTAQAQSEPQGDSCSCISLVGDEDNFGRQTCCWDVTHEPDDGDFDIWNTAPKSWTHKVFVPQGAQITYAALTIRSFNVQDGGTSYDLKLYADGVEIADAFDQVYNQTAAITVFQLSTDVISQLKDHELKVVMTNASSAPQDSFAVDYSKLEVKYPCIVPVQIDIKPGSDPSSYGANSKGKIPVAVFGTSTFDVTRIDDSTVRFGNAAYGGAAPAHASVEDKNGDGIPDKVYHFSFQDTNLQIGDTVGYLSGYADGIRFLGSSDVNITGKGAAKGKK
ncbi:hypothetical protein [Paenibacillus gansuensis]|uniref:Uncharacterized protein n=1 Tax=Paenibacillus gansuensis TaxID=306542 RepID=A0ABW5P8I2_9BACL